MTANEGLNREDFCGNPLKLLYSNLYVMAAQHLVVMELDFASGRRNEQLSNRSLQVAVTRSRSKNIE